MEQRTFQSIPSLIAEEFELSLDQVTIKLTNGEKEFDITPKEAVLQLKSVIQP